MWLWDCLCIGISIILLGSIFIVGVIIIGGILLFLLIIGYSLSIICGIIDFLLRK